MRQFLSEVIKKWVLPYAKAWVAAGVTLVVGWLANWGFEVPEEVTLGLVTAITAFFVWLLPNIPFVKK